MTPKMFLAAVKGIVSSCSKSGEINEERFHLETDELMEKTLIQQGYEEGIDLIRKHERWYA